STDSSTSSSAYSRLFSTAPSPSLICTLSLHDALPIYRPVVADAVEEDVVAAGVEHRADRGEGGAELRVNGGIDDVGGRSEVRLPDRKSTRLNSSHVSNSYAVFCLKKKKKRKG